jgi:hypothetical protein
VCRTWPDATLAWSAHREVALSITSINLSRGVCYGPCPIYQVTLRSNGTARWHGEAFVEREGKWVATLDPAVWPVLEVLIEAVGFFEWADEYTREVTDVPEYRLSVRRDGTTKTVLQYGTDEPSGFVALASAVDAATERLEWRPDSAR